MSSNIKQSKTQEIYRSQVNLNPYNPKRHSTEQIRLQKKNIEEVGFLGGIVWNSVTGNLIDGHRRIQALDLHYKYDGTPETDYRVKVEEVSLSEKEEKEQMTYMALGNTKADLNLVAQYIPDIDITKTYIAKEDIEEIRRRTQIDVSAAIETIDVDAINAITQKPEKSDEEKKAHVKEVKAEQKRQAEEAWQDTQAYITLSFSDYESKADLCKILGCDPDITKFIKGEDVLSLIQ